MPSIPFGEVEEVGRRKSLDFGKEAIVESQLLNTPLVSGVETGCGGIEIVVIFGNRSGSYGPGNGRNKDCGKDVYERGARKWFIHHPSDCCILGRSPYPLCVTYQYPSLAFS